MVENAIELTNVSKKFNINQRKNIFSSIKKFHSDNQPKFLMAINDVSFIVGSGKIFGKANFIHGYSTIG